MFVVRHVEIFPINGELNTINTHHKMDLQVPSVNLSKVQKGVYYSGVKLFNSLPRNIKTLTHNTNQFKKELNKFLIENPFYSITEYTDRSDRDDTGDSRT